MVKAVVPNLCRVFSMGVFMHWWLAERSSTKFVQGLFNGEFSIFSLTVVPNGESNSTKFVLGLFCGRIYALVVGSKK